MRVLFYLEPVIFQGNPLFLRAHFFWVRTFRNAVQRIGGAFGLAANPSLCNAWAQEESAEEPPSALFPLDPFRAVAPFGYDRAAYARALYAHANPDSPLCRELRQIAESFSPDIVVCTSQSSFVAHAFGSLRTLSIEQAPLPRLGYPLRTVLDPLGHQVNALLAVQAERIRALPLSETQRVAVSSIWESIRAGLSERDPAAKEACGRLNELGDGDRIALLATQPPDWVTYEGAGRQIVLEGLIAEWAASLPAGWIGVPTYHPGFRLPEPLEQALATSFPNLRFLPQACSQGTTEALLSVADGLVTLSSTSAITAILSQKHLVVTGASPFNAWAPTRVSELGQGPLLRESEVSSTLAFLSHRYSHLQQELEQKPDELAGILEALQACPDPQEWFLDLSSFDAERVRQLFPGAVAGSP